MNRPPAGPLERTDGELWRGGLDTLAVACPRLARADMALRALPRRLPPGRWQGRLLLAADAAREGEPAPRLPAGAAVAVRRLPDDATLPEVVLVTWRSPDGRATESPDAARFPDAALLGTGPASLAEGGLGVWVRRPVVLDRLRRWFDATWHRAASAADADATRQRSGLASAAEGSEHPGARQARGVSLAVRERVGPAVSGALAYARALDTFFGPAPHGPDSEPFDLTAFQREAAERAAEALDRFGGAIVADSVGLGKTYVGLALVERALRRGDAVLVVTPAALRRDWDRALARLRRRHRRGLAWVSTERLGRRPPPRVLRRGFGLVLVDEAHQFRNPATQRYRALARCARGARVALLTATPVNNHPRDLLHLLELFAGTADFRPLGVPDLRAAFRDPARLGEAIAPLLGTVVIRRTRPFVRARYGPVLLPGRGGAPVALRFPRRAPPRALRYDLADTYGPLYRTLDRALERLRFAALHPFASDASRREGCAALLRISLLKRMESSVEAFRRSVARQRAFHQEWLRAAAEGRALTTRLFRRLFEVGDERDAVQTTLGLALPDRASARADRRTIRAVERDLAALDALHAALRDFTADRDGKLRAVRAWLEAHAREKVLLFTEFRDTARYLFRELRGLGHVAQIDHARAVLGGDATTARGGDRRAVIERFAPFANGVRPPPDRERVDVLIATDVLSEGLNLQDARHVVSYDLPWNPVRLVQRAGRIDRLGSPHDVVHVHYLVPDSELERWLDLLGRLQEKIAGIEETVGLDAPVLEWAGVARAARLGGWLRRLDEGAADALDEVEREDAEPFEWAERVRLEFRRWAERWPDIVSRARARDGPCVAAVRAGPSEAPGFAFYFRAEAPAHPGRDLWLVADGDATNLRPDRAAAVARFTRARDLPAAEPGPALRAARRRARAIARRWADACSAQATAPHRVDASTPQGRALRWLHAASAWLDATARARLGPKLDRIAAPLSRRRPRGWELDLEPVVRNLPPVAARAHRRTPPDTDLAHDIERGIAALEAFLARRPEWTAEAPPPARYRAREVAAVELRPATRRPPSPAYTYRNVRQPAEPSSQ